MLVASMIAAVLALAAAGGAVFFVLNQQEPGPGTAGAPSDVKLFDSGDRVTLTWVDPSNGNAQPIVVGSRENEASRRMGVPGKGATTTTLLSLNRNFEYCFIILLAYSVDDIRQSEQVCTNRNSASPPAA